MRVQADHEKERKVMGVPERFETLMANLVMCGRVHEQHDQQHEVTGDASWLCVVNLQGSLLADLCKAASLSSVTTIENKERRTSSLDVNEIDIMSSRVYHSPERHLICNLTMEPNVLICREKPGEPWSDDTNDVSQHGNEDESSVQGKNKTCTAGGPDRPCEGIQTR